MAVNEGDVITVPEDAYMYGRGPLTLRVTRVRRDLMPRYDNKWVVLRGHIVHWNGTEDRQRFSFLVSVAALPDGTV
jgi:hypothetical protein